MHYRIALFIIAYALPINSAALSQSEVEIKKAAASTDKFNKTETERILAAREIFFKFKQHNPHGLTGPGLPSGLTNHIAEFAGSDKVGSIRREKSLPELDGGIGCIKMSPDGKYLMAGDYKHEKLALYDFSEWECLKQCNTEARVVSWAPDSQQCATVSYKQNGICLWGLNKDGFGLLTQLHAINDESRDVCFGDNTHVFDTGYLIRRWDCTTEQPTTLCTNSEEVFKLDVMGDFIITGVARGDSESSSIKIWDARSGRCSHTMPHSGILQHLKCIRGVATPQCVSASWDGTIRQWDMGSGKLMHTYEEAEKQGPVRSLALDDRGIMVSGHQRHSRQLPRWYTGVMEDDFVRVWDTIKGTLIKKIPTVRDEQLVDISPDGSAVITTERAKSSVVLHQTYQQEMRKAQELAIKRAREEKKQ